MCPVQQSVQGSPCFTPHIFDPASQTGNWPRNIRPAASEATSPRMSVSARAESLRTSSPRTGTVPLQRSSDLRTADAANASAGDPDRTARTNSAPMLGPGSDLLILKPRSPSRCILHSVGERSFAAEGHLSLAIKAAAHVGGSCREPDAGRGLVEARERGKCDHAAPPTFAWAQSAQCPAGRWRWLRCWPAEAPERVHARAVR